MFPADTLKLLLDTHKTPPNARIVMAPSSEPKHVYYVEQPDGKLERIEAEPEPDKLQSADLDTLVRVAVEAQQEHGKDTYIWYSRDEVKVVNRQVPRWKATLDLNPSPQIAALTEWDYAGQKRLTQQEFVIALRTLFFGCAPELLLPAVRNIRTSKAADLNSQIAQGKVSLGKSIVAEMSGASAIPETVTFTVPVFAEASVLIHAPVRLAIDPDPQSEVFRLIVLPGDIELAFALAEESLAHRLIGLLDTLTTGELEPIKVYRGTP